MKLTELESLAGRMRTLGIKSFKGTAGEHNEPVELELGEPPMAPVPQPKPQSAAARRRAFELRELTDDWRHVGGAPPFVIDTLDKALATADAERLAATSDDEDAEANAAGSN